MDGIIRAKEQGLIDHVCVSLHSDPETTLKIVKEGIFEGITISLNVLNYKKWLKVLEEASRRQIAVVTMNSLGGGIIPRYGKLFDGIDDSDDTVPIKALRFVLNIPGVHIALSGMPTKEIVDENLEAVKYVNSLKVNFDYSLPVEESLCSGCNYCAPCTVGIPISACMQAYNHKILTEAVESFTEEQQMANDVFIRIRANGIAFPDLSPCLGCHVCERRCTQKIPISQRMRWLKMESERYGYDNETIRKRLISVEEKCRDSRKIAIWPAADYASRVLDYWGNEDFERRCVFVNASPAMWGRTFRGVGILSPDSVETEGVDTIVIMHHRLQDKIYAEISGRYKNMKIVCLHEPTDIDWFNRMI